MITIIPHGLFPIQVNQSTDASVRLTSCYFGQTYVGPQDHVWPNNEAGGGYCERSGIWFPTSMLVRDASGKLVGEPYALWER